MTKNNAYIITNPMIAANRSGEVTLSKFLRVISPFFEHITVIGGNLSVEPDLTHIKLLSFDITRAGNKVRRALDIAILQLRMCIMILKVIPKNSPVYFWIGDKMLLPYFATKRKGAEINYFIYGNVEKEGKPNIFSKLSSKLIRFMASHADYTCMESRSVLNEWQGLTARKCKIIHLYTNNIEQNSIEARKKIIGMICRLTAGKHVLESIEAMVSVHNDHPDWQLEIIGSGRQQAACEMLVKELKADGYISLLGWVDHDEIIEKSKKWSYLLFPTDTEGLPNSLLEMMGRGIPALISPVGGIQEVVLDGYNGFVISGTTAEKIKEGIQKIISINKDEYKKCCENAYGTIAKTYSLDGAIENAKLELMR